MLYTVWIYLDYIFWKDKILELENRFVVVRD